jgi:thioredoxin 1
MEARRLRRDEELIMATVKVTDENFETAVLQSTQPVLVDFWAEWCGPCKQIAPALDQISEELSGQIIVAKVNIEDSPTTPSRYGVRGVPTMMLFKDGQMAAMKVGAMPKAKIIEWLSETGVQAA